MYIIYPHRRIADFWLWKIVAVSKFSRSRKKFFSHFLLFCSKVNWEKKKKNPLSPAAACRQLLAGLQSPPRCTMRGRRYSFDKSTPTIIIYYRYHNTADDTADAAVSAARAHERDRTTPRGRRVRKSIFHVTAQCVRCARVYVRAVRRADVVEVVSVKKRKSLKKIK